MNKILVIVAVAIMSLSVGCVGMGVTVSPGDGRISLDFQASDCITNNVAGRTISAMPYVGDWAMLHWGCEANGIAVGDESQ